MSPPPGRGQTSRVDSQGFAVLVGPRQDNLMGVAVTSARTSGLVLLYCLRFALADPETARGPAERSAR
jgi:hypothetical protein